MEEKRTYYLRHAADETATAAIRTADNQTEEVTVTAKKPFSTTNPLYVAFFDARVGDLDFPITDRAPRKE